METKDQDFLDTGSNLNNEVSAETNVSTGNSTNVASEAIKTSPSSSETTSTINKIESSTKEKKRSKKGGFSKQINKTKKYFRTLPKTQTALYSAGAATILVGTALAIPLAIIASNPGSVLPPSVKPSDYTMQFDTTLSKTEIEAAGKKLDSEAEQKAAINAKKVKNDYLAQVKSDVKAKLDEYEKTNPDFKQLKLQFITLRSAPSDQERLYFNELNLALQNIDPRLSFEMLDRTDTTLQQGYYEKNTEMVMFLWSPDFNSVQTWLKYMFQDSYQVANFWPPVWKEIMKTESDHTWIKQPAPSGGALGETGLKAYMSDDKIKNVKISNSEGAAIDFNLLTDPVTISDYASKHKLNFEDVYVYIANTVSGWVVANPNYGFEMVSWMNQFNNNLPYYENGPKTTTTWLVRNNLNIIQDSNSDMNFADWFTQGSWGDKEVKYRWAGDLFEDPTFLNPNFAQATNSTYMNSVQTNLYKWENVRTYKTEEDGSITPIDTSKIQPTGAIAEKTGDLLPTLQTGDVNEDGDWVPNEGGSKKALTFKIRPTQWINQKGEAQEHYLSPADFLAGLKSYKRSVDVKINNNGYFNGLLGLDYESTVKVKSNEDIYTKATADAINEGKNENYLEYTLVLQSPTLSVGSMCDILSKQYFAAAPSWVQEVKNITTDAFFEQDIYYTPKATDENPKPQPKKYTKDDLGEQTLDTKASAKAFAKFYSCGTSQDFSGFGDGTYSAAPYYISDLNEQKAEFKINSNYFTSLTQLEKDDGRGETYQGQILNVDANGTKTLSSGNETRTKPKHIVVTYGASTYKEETEITRFDADDVDWASVPGTLKDNIINNSSYNQFVVENLLAKASTSTLVPYNLQVYQRDPETNKFVKEDGKTTFDAVGIDEYGNFEFGDNVPSLKSEVSKEYNDLIVKDYYTPYYPGSPSTSGFSATIRTAINDLVDWYSLAAIVQGSNVKAFQQSFMPFGVYETKIGGETELEGKFWDIATKQGYLKSDNSLNYVDIYTIPKIDVDPSIADLIPEYVRLLSNRKTSLTTWTYDEYFYNSQS